VSRQLADTPTPDEVDPTGFDAVLFAGGHGTMWDFRGDARLSALAIGVDGAGGVVAALCHGPAALVDLTMADGTPFVARRRLTAFTNAEESASGLTDVVPFALQTALEQRGAQHVGGPDFAANVVVDARLVTGQNPASAAGTAEAVVAVVRARLASTG
jgi:putative intracellular protease/amidase